MKIFSKKRIVLFLLFIFPLICFLILSTGENNFTKLPVVTKSLIDINDLDSIQVIKLKDHVSVVCFLGNDIEKSKSGLSNLNEKIYKTFIDYNKFQVIAIYPTGKETEAKALEKKLGAYTDMRNWNFIAIPQKKIEIFYSTFSTNFPLDNLSSSKAFLIDKNVDLRGRVNYKDNKDEVLYGYNMSSVSELNDKLKDDLKVLFYEYYAAFKIKNKNKADRQI